jgi:serine/threonine protein kinase
MCLVLEWVASGSLANILDKSKVELTWEDLLLRLAMDIARGMDFLHRCEYIDEADGKPKCTVLHRDLKPDNILITKFQSAKISDFGASRAKSTEDVMMTAVGTPLFSSPEVMRGEMYDEKADVYSFGMTLMAMAVNEPLLTFIGERWRVAFKKERAPLQAIRIIRPMTEDGWRPVTDQNVILTAPMAINFLIMKCCSHEARVRPTFEEILGALNGICSQEVMSRTLTGGRSSFSTSHDRTNIGNQEPTTPESIHADQKVKNIVSPTENEPSRQHVQIGTVSTSKSDHLLRSSAPFRHSSNPLFPSGSRPSFNSQSSEILHEAITLAESVHV